MTSKWKSKSIEKVKIILESFTSYMTKQPDGNIGFTSSRYNNDIAALVSLTKFSPEIPYEQQERIIRAAVSIAKKKDRFHHGAISEEIKKEEATYLNRL